MTLSSELASFARGEAVQQFEALDGLSSALGMLKRTTASNAAASVGKKQTIAVGLAGSGGVDAAAAVAACPLPDVHPLLQPIVVNPQVADDFVTKLKNA